VVLVAKDGKVILEKAYGYHTYENRRPVETDDIYDLASVTKISTSLAALMKLTDEGKFSVDGTLANYLPEYRRSNKADIPLRDILTHQGPAQGLDCVLEGHVQEKTASSSGTRCKPTPRPATRPKW
jgi:CubicO group peptidase (beta-lactamase class C family)